MDGKRRGTCMSATCVRDPPPARSQSAMEYLMTYGWAILIIAVVLGALYALGVFNAINFAPKVGPGGCHVFRPNGPGTSWNVNLVGSCNNALPQYVAQFNGQSSAIVMQSNTVFTTGFTEAAWVKFASASATFFSSPVSGAAGSSVPSLLMGTWGGFPGLCAGGTGIGTACVPATRGVWYLEIGVYNSSGAYIYKNGVLGNRILGNNIEAQQPLEIGAGFYGADYVNGSIANVQVYNTSLSANQIAYLYNEGIGGVPVQLQNLVGWWPLNGDTNDYSGNNNDGIPTNVIFNGTWTGGYAPP